MSKEKIKVYLYTRVSTSIQIDGYSLEAQKTRMKAFALYNDYEIVGEYEDAGKSGKSIEGRAQFTRMMEDIKSGKDGVSFVLVFKLSRFARNAADVLSTLQTMQDFGVNLICVEDGIDSSKDAGKLMISVLSAVAEIERENIRVQTMEGRIQKAREGKWNGGFAPYGYKLVDGKLLINEEEAVAIRTIFEQYVNTTIGANGLSKYLENHGIRKIPRQNGKNPLFDAGLIRKILKNPVYKGKIAFGRRTLEKVHGTRNEYKQVEQDEYLIAEGIHEAIISDELWQAAQVKLKSQAKKYEHVNKGKDVRTHLLSGIVKCPICGVGMFGNKCIKKKKDGTKYKDFYYYGCKHRQMIRGHKCTFSKQIREELLDDAVAELIIKIVSNPKFASIMQEKINMKVDTSEIEKEIDNYQKELRKSHSIKFKLIEEIDNLNVDDKHYKRRKQDLDDRLYRMYDKIEELESLLIDAKAKKQTIEAEKLTGDNIYKVLIYFDKLYNVMNDVERRQLITSLISEIQIYEKKQPNGQWLKSITFKLPIIDEDLNISLDNDEQVEPVVPPTPGEKEVLFSKVNVGGEEIAGAKIQIKDAQGQVVKEWTSKAGQSEIIKLKAGTYIFHEEAAPNGYLKVTDITFEVDEQGKVTVKNADGNEVKANGNKLTVTDKTKSPTPETPWTPMIPSTRNLKVTKKWLGTNGNKITAPVDKIEVELYKDGKATGQKLELNKANSWTGEFKDLKAYESIENSKAYEYTVKEVGENNNSIKLGNKLFKVTYSGNMKDGIEVVNTESPALSPSIPSEKPKKSKLAKTGIGASASIYSGILAISGGIMLFLKKRNQK